MNGDLGEQTVKTMMDVTEKGVDATIKAAELVGKLLKFLFTKDYDKALKKAQIKDIKAKTKDEKAKSFKAGENKVKKMQKSGENLTYAKFGMTQEQVKDFNFYAKQRGIPVAWIQNGHDKNTYIAVFRTKDSAILEDITVQLIRDRKIDEIDKAKAEATHYQKTTFDKAVNEVSSDSFKNPVFVCERTNPGNYMQISSKNEISDKGTSYVNTEFKVFKDGKQQKCDEFSHGRFEHWSDKSGRNTSNYGDEHWTNIKNEMREKGEFSDDLLVFASEGDYKRFVEQFQAERAEVEKDSDFYNELDEKKEETIGEDIGSYRNMQTEAIYNNIIGESGQENPALTFNDTIERFRCKRWSKDEPYYICDRTNPENYIEIASEKAEYLEEEYTKNTYSIYADGKPVENKAREDGKWTDERFEGMSADFWKKQKEAMKAEGKFSDDLVVFKTKEEMLEYQKAFEEQKANAKQYTAEYEKDKAGFDKDYGSIADGLRTQMQQLEGKEDKHDIAKKRVISEQIDTFEKMGKLSNEIVEAEMQMPDTSAKIDEMKQQMAEYEKQAEDLSKKREQLAGIEAEKTAMGGMEEEMEERPHGEEISMEQMKEDVANRQQQDKGNTQNQDHIKEKTKDKDDRDR